MAGCRVKNLHYHCKDDSWTPIESALIKLVRENPPLYTRGGRGSRTKKLMVSLMWSDISDQLGLPESRLQEIWRRIVAEWAIINKLSKLGYPVRNFPRANKFLITNFSFLDNYIMDLKDADVPHNILDIYRKKFAINGSVMRANCSFPAGTSTARTTTDLAPSNPGTGTSNSEVAGAASSSGVVGSASGTPSQSGSLGATAVSVTSCDTKCANTPAKSNTSTKPSVSGKKDKTGVELTKKSEDHGKSGSNSKAGSHTKSGDSRSTGRKSKHK